jgi:drug/metabolite transporter (DMT)-like permease
MATQNTNLGIWLMVAAATVFALQDGLSRHLASTYNVWMIVMIRYWFFAAFVVVLASRAPGGLAAAITSQFPRLQVVRGVLLAFQICVMVYSFTLLGLSATHAVFAAYPLMVSALSGPILGEKVGWRRWAAVLVGFSGILVILQPGFAVFDPLALIPLFGAFLFALYGLLTRYVGRKDTTSVSFFWTGTGGAVVMTAVGIWFWEPMSAGDSGLMALLCCTAALSHWLLIRAYELAEASAVQPFAYLQLPMASMIGVFVFDEALTASLVLGAAIVVMAGLFTLRRARLSAGGR